MQVFVTNHVLSGIVIGRVLGRRPATAFVVGVGSHLLLDSIPHWSCDKSTDGGRERFLKAAKRDGVLGLATMAAATLVADRRVRTATVAAMAGAVLLDLDKPLLYFFRVNPFPRPVQRLHGWVQNESPDGMPSEVGFGVICAAVSATILSRTRQTSGNRSGDGRRTPNPRIVNGSDSDSRIQSLTRES
jgi:hypothetical protein